MGGCVRDTNIWLEYYLILAEVPGADWVNLQPAEYLLFCLQKCFLQLMGFQAPRLKGVGGGGQTCAKTFLGLVEMR